MGHSNATLMLALSFIFFCVDAFRIREKLDAPVETGEKVEKIPQPDSVMDEARLNLVEAVRSGQDPLLASQEFSAVALQVAREAYAEVVAGADLPPHALLAGGSGGRYEMGTFSDLEYMVVFADVCKNKKVLDALPKLLSKFRSALKKHGIESDAINQPQVRKGTIACSPSDFVQNILFAHDEVTLSMALEASFFAGEQDVATQIHEEISNWLSKPKEDAVIQVKLKRSTRERMLASAAKTVGDYLASLVSDWKFGPKHYVAIQSLKAMQGSDGDSFNIKGVLYRPLQNVLFAQTLMAPRTGNFTSFNALAKLQFLESSGKWTSTLVAQVREALSMAVRLRILAHAGAGKESDEACMKCSDVMGSIKKGVFRISSEMVPKLLETAHIVACAIEEYPARAEKISVAKLNTANLVPSKC